MFPLLNRGSGQPDYLTLDEALAIGCTQITEISEGGSVPELKLVNGSERRVLLLDGEELIGAKQNRILNLTVLVPPLQTLVIPVSCVEQGRWSERSEKFTSAGRTHYSSGRSAKMEQVTQSLLTTGARASDQSAIWTDISKKSIRMGSDSPTQAMAAMYERHDSDLEDYVGAFSAVEGQVGALFAINNRVIGVDLFDYALTLQKILPKLVLSYALDAIDSSVDRPTTPSVDSAKELLQALTKAEAKRFPAVGDGEDVRLSATNLAGGALVADERVVHLSAFRCPDANRNLTEENFSAIPNLTEEVSQRFQI
jgi:hypothetical protein